MKCNIKSLGKFRNGTPKLWCKVHFAFVKQDGTVIPTECENSSLPKISEEDKFLLDPDDWDGGIGIWGSLNPVYDTSLADSHKEGIHLHTRTEKDALKTIDFTFKEIKVRTGEVDLFGEHRYINLNTEIAHAYTASMVFGKEMKFLSCSHCKEPHIDADYYAVTYHKKHLCSYCGREFRDKVAGIANPVVEILRIFKSSLEYRSIELVDRVLEIDQKDYPGGIQIWGSNPAIIWTADRPEEAGIHLHVYAEDGITELAMDDTYGRVVIDGLELNERQIRCLMVQNSLSHLNEKVAFLSCPKCQEPHFDFGDYGIRPHKTHLCEFCSTEFQTEVPCVGNPVIEILDNLKRNYHAMQK